MVENYDIPEGLQEFETGLLVNVPSGNDDGQYDEGDYHFHIIVTDKEGWSTNFAIGLKMVHR